jgi:ubiquinone/menaquinone biosynthesis C-methylase UbiE
MPYMWEEVEKKRYSKALKWFEQRTLVKAIGDYRRNSCLDVGGGFGHRFPVNCENYTLLEIDPEAIAIFRRNCPEGHFIEGDFLALNIDKKYDVIIMVQLSTDAEHINKMVAKAYSLLSEGGMILFTTTNKSSYKGLLYSTGWYGYQEPYSALKKFLTTLGASSIKYYGYGWLPFRRDSDSILIPMLKWIDVVLGKFVSISPWLFIVVKK